MSLCVWEADPSPRLPATEWKATKRPSAEIEASSDDASPPAPAGPLARLTNVVVFVCRSRTKTSGVSSFASSAVKFSDTEVNATKRPSAEIDGAAENPSPASPATPLARLTYVVVPVCRSRT